MHYLPQCVRPPTGPPVPPRDPSQSYAQAPSVGRRVDPTVGAVGYQRPCDAPVSDSWQGHKDRNPPSSEPGTDYACAVGTSLLCADAGTVIDRKTTNSGAMGRYVAVALDDGRTYRMLHMQSVAVAIGDRVARAQSLGRSGASANGSEWGVGAHVHTTLWPGPYWAAPTIDFDAHVGPPPGPPPTEQDEDMPGNSGFYYTRSSDQRTVWYVTNPVGYWVEWSDSSMTVDQLAAAYDTGPFARVTEGMRNVAYTAAANMRVRSGGGVPQSTSTSAGITRGHLLIGIVATFVVAVIDVLYSAGVIPS